VTLRKAIGIWTFSAGGLLLAMAAFLAAATDISFLIPGLAGMFLVIAALFIAF
jgi:hypothetical protein